MIPENLTVEEFLLDEEKNLYRIHLIWEKPLLQPDYYNVSLHVFPDKSGILKVEGNETEAYFNHVELSMYYEVTLTAFSEGGKSDVAAIGRHLKLRKSRLKRSIIITDIFIITIGVVILVFALPSGFLLYAKYNKNQQKNTEQRRVYFHELDDTKSSEAESPLQEPDEWEIDHTQLLLHTVLGEGAFGVVRRALIRSPDGEMKEVAIKMLKDAFSQDEVRQFQQEINIMKSVGAHPHLVSIIGCVTRTCPEGPLLVVEYCSKGNLQCYLRSAWEQLCNFERNFTSVDSAGNNVANMIYELSLVHEFVLQPKDLISFAHQITLGMEHLANMKVVHRDLAARNVLVCENNCVKISDFGLSRDIYQDSVYCKTTSGKVPIRWLALESLTHQRYTTKSDIWSFGVLLWEIVTLGGNPYPGVSSQDLLPMLQSGYRMDRPASCSAELYSIMEHCWRTSPQNRPTFTQLRTMLANLLENIGQYLNLNIFVDQKFHSNEYYLNPTNAHH